MCNIILGLLGWFRKTPYNLLLALLLMTHNLPAHAEEGVNVPTVALSSSVSSSQSERAASEEITPDITQLGVQLDPLDSPHPIPWNWVLTTQAELSAKGKPGVRYYRSPSLVSPDGMYAAYSRIQMDGEPELYKSRVTSVMFLENLHTGDLHTVTAVSPLSDNPLTGNEDADLPGAISILIPISWSKSGDRLLARQFEAMFSTSDASDFALIWDRKQNRTTTLAPKTLEDSLPLRYRLEYSAAVLLGWSQTQPDRVLFRAGEMGDENPPVWAVELNNQTTLALEEEPIIYGQFVNQVWAGPQARW